MSTDSQREGEILLRGIGVSPGVAIGPAYPLTREMPNVVERQLGEEDVEHEMCRLEKALIETRRQIKSLQKDLEERTQTNDSSILDAHLMVLDDRTLVEDIITEIREGRRNAEAAVKRVSDRYTKVLSSVGDDYLRERVADVRDVVRRIIRNLVGARGTGVEGLKKKRIVIAQDMAPSETAALRKDLVVGFATDLGSPTSHTAVMARALEIPAIVALREVTANVSPGDEVLIDGNKGIFIIRPTHERLEEYGKVAETRKTIEKGLTSLRHEPAETLDHHRIVLSANVEGPEEVDAVMEYGAEGVGLFRSEYLHLSRGEQVSESEQEEVYLDVALRVAPAPVIIRTLDLGGDKFFGTRKTPKEANPFLGCRSIRLSLRHPEIFKGQLRAIVKANQRGNVKIMYPMISNVGEVLQANALLEEVKQELEKAGAEFSGDIEVGAMIEIPSAALMADVIAQHVDFFSLGTNDLIQYTLAVDRVNESVAYLYEPTHPAVLKLIRHTIEAGHRQGIWVGLCGEMAADPILTPLLVGLEVDELSVAPSAVPLVKDAVRSLRFERAKDLAEKALKSGSGLEVLRHCRELMREIAPEILELV